jgi:hypothetical protein
MPVCCIDAAAVSLTAVSLAAVEADV